MKTTLELRSVDSCRPGLATAVVALILGLGLPGENRQSLNGEVALR